MKFLFENMQRLILILLFLCCLLSCKSSKRVSDNSKKVERTSTEKTPTYSLANNIVKNAEAYKGIRYKYGGITSKGMDCTGLIYVAFKKENIVLPRISKDMSKKGIRIKRHTIQKGDLLFFKTNKSRNVINHVGLVVTSRAGFVEFIHSTTSKGVIISSLTERYWHSAFIEARRVL